MIRSNLKGLLEAEKISLYRLAKDTGVSYTALHKLAAGKAKMISFDTLDKLCTRLKCTAGDILEHRPG